MQEIMPPKSIRSGHATDRGRLRRSRLGAALGIALCIVPGALPALAGQIPPDIPLLPRLGVGARAMGMGGAYTAVSEDYTALSYNPAGLAQIRRVEVGVTFDHRSLTQDITYLGTVESTPLSKSNLQSVGFAYPFPTYRGSMVIAFSYDRLTPLDQDYLRSGSGSYIQFEQESIQEDGYVGAYQAGFAADVSPNLALGLTATILSGTSRRDRDFQYRETNPSNYELTTTNTDMDISAVTGSLGALFHATEGLRLGLNIHLPEKFTLNASATDDVRRYQQTPAADTLDYVDSYDFEDKVELPFRLGGGAAYAPPSGPLRNILISLDATYADWQQIDYFGPIRMNNRKYTYRPTTDLRVGIEYALPKAPVRLRAGFVSEPLAYKPIATDVYNGLYQHEATLEQNRRYFTLGGGILIDQSLTLDLAFVTGGYERSGRMTVGGTAEKIKDQRVYLGAAFRL
jgi:hypothetical protein